ncbi:MAG: mannose-1-phosphate guanylyltransferase [Spirochaetaceae bacterium]|jgi:mannose-1-phosphate guanylyltransferase/mannose-6-phosphate isomerase|nr:mannose-1-phosphate guanylyltransferase [Spirochaetaceae bacterium]
MFTDIVILAGGIGERLWPLSTKTHPKQFIVMGGGLSFFQMALERSLLFQHTQRIHVVTRSEFEGLVLEQCLALRERLPGADAERLDSSLTILLEPCPRHTAAAVQLALAWAAHGEGPGERTVLVLTSDHIISTGAQFASSCQKAARSAAGGYFVCFGIPPSFPATGFGYIEAGDPAPDEEGVYEIRSFKEKPDEATAQAFLQRGGYWWNSGMFAFREDLYRREIARSAPGIPSVFAALEKTSPKITRNRGVNVLRDWEGLGDVYARTEPVSIDSAVAEKTDRARCVIAEFAWDDIGSWDAFAACAPPSQDHAVFVESSGCSVYSDIPVALCGVSGIIVAIKDGKALIVRKGRSGLVREAVRESRLRGDES